MVIWGRHRGGNEPDLLVFGLTLNLGSSYQPLGWFSRGIPLIGEEMAEVRRQKGDKTKVNANGVLVITRANGNVIKINGPKGTITRLKADGTVVKQKLTSPKANNFTSGPITKIRSQNVKKTPTKRGGR